MDDVEEGTSSWGKWVIGGIAAVVVLVLGVVAALVVSIAAIAGSGASGCIPAVGATTSARAASSSSSTTTPDELEVPYGPDDTTTLDAKQLAHAQAIISRASQKGVSGQGIKIALMTALQESTLRMYANSSVPESLGYPHEAIGSDHDSVGLFQQRPPGWGNVKELMTVEYSVDAFFGGPDGPNGGSPRGLLDVDGWESMSPGKAAQTVQVSAYPSAYDKWEPAADLLIQTLGTGASCSAGDMNGMALPLKSDYNMTSGYGPRDPGVSGASTWHAAIDLQRWPNPCGDPIYAILPGEVVLSSSLWLSIKHADGFVVSYLHTYKSERVVDVGDTVTAGEQIAAVGNVPPSSGCHLDIRINVADNTNPEVATLQRSEALGATGYNRNFVNPEEFMRLWGVEVCPLDTCRRP